MIKVGFCVAYDWMMLKTSLPIVYPHADKICLALDKDLHAWSGEPFNFDRTAFYEFVRTIDTQLKIDIYEDDFSLPELNSRENCNRHRHKIAERMGEGGWHVQIDADEYFLDFKLFVNHLKKIDPNPSPKGKPINICAPFVPLIKKVNDGYLYVDFLTKDPEIIPMATNVPDYQRARQNGHFNHMTPCYVIHETWARSDDELWYKINNWGHASEELEEKQRRLSYYNLWKALDKYNFHYISDFHPASAPTWPALQYVEAASIHKLIAEIQPRLKTFTSAELAKRNNRNLARIKSLIKK